MPDYKTKQGTNPRLIARMADLYYLLTGGTAFAIFTRGKLLMERDAATAASNVLATNPCSFPLSLRIFSEWPVMSRSLHIDGQEPASQQANPLHNILSDRGGACG